MENILIDAGLTTLQAKTYLYLLAKSKVQPKYLMTKLNISRTNTYKVLDSLEKLGLVKKTLENSKTTYYPDDPIALASLVAEKRNKVISLEHNVNEAMQQLRDSYNKNPVKISVETSFGKNSIIDAYSKQAQQQKPIYFIRSRADIPFMGFEIMDSVRRKQGELTKARYGITPDSIEAPINKEIDNSSFLSRTWVGEDDYTSPVEWSVNGDNIVIQVFDGKGETMVINNHLIAESFAQLWHITDNALKNSNSYSKFPIKAKRQK
jgi:predicted transcriptional regulator